MADNDSFASDSSPPSPINGPSKEPGSEQSNLRITFDERLYSLSSPHKQSFHFDSERSSLLHQHDGIRSYHSSPRVEHPDPFDTTSGSPRPLGILTRKISRVFQSKAYDYDSNKNSLAAVGSGERVW